VRESDESVVAEAGDVGVEVGAVLLTRGQFGGEGEDMVNGACGVGILVACGREGG